MAGTFRDDDASKTMVPEITQAAGVVFRVYIDEVRLAEDSPTVGAIVENLHPQLGLNLRDFLAEHASQALMRIVDIMHGEKPRVSLADPVTLLVTNDREGVTPKAFPPFCYVGQLVLYDAQQRAMTNLDPAELPMTALRLPKPWSDTLRIAVSILRSGVLTRDEIEAFRMRYKASHHVIFKMGGSVDCSTKIPPHAIVCDEFAVRLQISNASTEHLLLPIVFAPRTPGTFYLSDGRFVGEDKLSLLLDDMIIQQTAAPGQYLTGFCSVPAAALQSYHLTPNDLWVVCPAAAGQKASAHLRSSNHQLTCITNIALLDLVNQGPLFRSGCKVTFC